MHKDVFGFSFTCTFGEFTQIHVSQESEKTGFELKNILKHPFKLSNIFRPYHMGTYKEK